MAVNSPLGLSLTLYRSVGFGVNVRRNLLHRVEQVVVTEIHWADGRVTPMSREGQVVPAATERPAVALVQRRGVVGAHDNILWHVEPLSKPGHVMFGGTYAATSDDRLSRAIGGFYGALAVHDWSET